MAEMEWRSGSCTFTVLLNVGAQRAPAQMHLPDQSATFHPGITSYLTLSNPGLDSLPVTARLGTCRMGIKDG